MPNKVREMTDERVNSLRGRIRATDEPFDPWNDLTDAREVLERLILLIMERAPGGDPKPRPDLVIKKHGNIAKYSGDALAWEVSIGYIVSAAALGPHEGPAICELVVKVMGERKEKR